jgi:hypothetical protein
VKVKLADGKARTIQRMSVTSFWHPDCTPMSAQQFMESLFGKLPEFFKDEDELRAIWSQPDTRRKLLEALAGQGFGSEQLAEMQKIIDAEKSDILDVLFSVSWEHFWGGRIAPETCRSKYPSGPSEPRSLSSPQPVSVRRRSSAMIPLAMEKSGDRDALLHLTI